MVRVARIITRLNIGGPAIQAAMLARSHRINQLAVSVKHLDFQVTEDVARLLVISDYCFLRPALAGESSVAFRPAGKRVDVLNAFAVRQESGVRAHDIRRQRAQ